MAPELEGRLSSEHAGYSTRDEDPAYAMNELRQVNAHLGLLLVVIAVIAPVINKFFLLLVIAP